MSDLTGFQSAPTRLTPGWRLGLAVAAMGLTWLVLLPRIAALPAVRATIEQNEAAGVDPAAKFYTEVPAMPRLLEQVRQARADWP